MKSYLLASVFVLSAAMAATKVSAQTANQYPFQNPALPLEERVNNAVSLMTLEEKIAFLTQTPSVPRLGIARVGWVEGAAWRGAGCAGKLGQHGRSRRPGAYDHVFPIHRSGRNLGSSGAPAGRRGGRLRDSLPGSESEVSARRTCGARPERRFGPRSPLGI